MRALREAGPPLRWIVAAIPLALAVVVVLYVAGVENRALLLAIPFVAFVLVCFIDRDGWRIRMAMAEVAGRQRERWRWGRIPIDAMSADAWLAAHACTRRLELRRARAPLPSARRACWRAGLVRMQPSAAPNRRAGERWRTDFANAVRDRGPFQVSRRYQVFHAIQQFALPIAYVGALLIVWGLGLADALLQG